MLILKCFLACCRKERVFQEFRGQANYLEVLPETLLGRCIENNKTFRYSAQNRLLFNISSWIWWRCVCMCALTELSVYVT